MAVTQSNNFLASLNDRTRRISQKGMMPKRMDRPATPLHGFKFTVENPKNPVIQMFIDWEAANSGKSPMSA